MSGFKHYRSFFTSELIIVFADAEEPKPIVVFGRTIQLAPNLLALSIFMSPEIIFENSELIEGLVRVGFIKSSIAAKGTVSRHTAKKSSILISPPVPLIEQKMKCEHGFRF